ncbi:hypothetical protein O6H91_Y321500 [Diphasiastrum complanatum]|nr:hypothetical protein O6H91_Y321500 [Diphasiastrum complanatum]
MMDSSNREEGVHRLALAMVSEGVDLVKTESLNKSKKRKKCKEGQKEVQPKKKALPTENQTIKPPNAFAKKSQASVTGAQKSDDKPKPKLAALQDSPKLLQSFVNGVLYNSKTTPIPYCSCTGVNQKCYRWGNGGWQSACCTNVISMYPLPMSPKKKGCRVPGRKMSAGAFERLLERLFLSGTNVSMAVDLKDHWAKHGTNRYVTIK